MAEKTHPPTPRRLRDVRKRGEVVLSADVVSALAFVGSVVALWLLGPHLFELLRALWDGASRDAVFARPEEHVGRTIALAQEVLLVIVLPIAALAALLGIVGAFSQVGALAAWQRIAPDVSHLNPSEGIKRLLSTRNLVNLFKTVVKTLLLSALMYFVVRASLQAALRAGYAPPLGVMHVAASILLVAFAWAAVIFVVMAMFDYAHQRFEFMKQHRMSIEDLRREYKDAEGDPQNLARRKAAYREAVYAALSDRVRSSSAVIYSTHVAVALQYLGERDLPRVVARGEGETAARLRGMAVASLVPTAFEPDLAHRLYDGTPLDRPIPRQLYAPTAALLRWAHGR